jgi:hypothetical protein
MEGDRFAHEKRAEFRGFAAPPVAAGRQSRQLAHGHRSFAIAGGFEL